MYYKRKPNVIVIAKSASVSAMSGIGWVGIGYLWVGWGTEYLSVYQYRANNNIPKLHKWYLKWGLTYFERRIYKIKPNQRLFRKPFFIPAAEIKLNQGQCTQNIPPSLIDWGHIWSWGERYWKRKEQLHKIAQFWSKMENLEGTIHHACPLNVSCEKKWSTLKKKKLKSRPKNALVKLVNLLILLVLLILLILHSEISHTHTQFVTT